MPEITFDRVEKRFGAYTVLEPLSLKLNDGEFTVLVGPSGCGKSTTLRILAGLEQLSSGEIFFNGEPISRLEPKDRDIAMVFQDYALYPHMDIARNMSFALRLKGTPRSEIDAKVKQVADMLGIGHLLARKPGELSGGQRQRVAMGRALVRDAGTFLFDEPLSNLDAKLRTRMRTELAEMSQRIEKNMVYVTHDQVEAMTLGDRIVVLNEGKVQQQGTPQELYTRPANRFVAGFIGSPPMNFLEGRLTEEKSKFFVQGDGFCAPLSREAAARIGKTTSMDVELGVRPSSFREMATDLAPFDLTVSVSEYLGAISVLATRCGTTPVLVEAPSHKVFKSGDRVNFGVSHEDILIFDRKSGLAL